MIILKSTKRNSDYGDWITQKDDYGDSITKTITSSIALIKAHNITEEPKGTAKEHSKVLRCTAYSHKSKGKKGRGATTVRIPNNYTQIPHHRANGNQCTAKPMKQWLQCIVGCLINAFFNGSAPKTICFQERLTSAIRGVDSLVYWVKGSPQQKERVGMGKQKTKSK